MSSCKANKMSCQRRKASRGGRQLLPTQEGIREGRGGGAIGQEEEMIPLMPKSASSHTGRQGWGRSLLLLFSLCLFHLQTCGVEAQTGGGFNPNNNTATGPNSTAHYNSTTPIPMLISNHCGTTLWPGIGTQGGIGPGLGGFRLGPHESRQLFVSADWQGRVWGRTNCSFNADGTGPSVLNGVNGKGASCLTGDCMGRLDCIFTGQVPSTLAEFNLMGGVDGSQTFYDLSLVDGYNLPVGIAYLPARNTTWIPPNLTNCACIATAGYLTAPNRTGLYYTNATYPIPYQPSLTNAALENWCPWDLQEYPPSKPGDGVYPYPDDNIARPTFDPCLSSCSATGAPADCCTEAFDNPETCQRSPYSYSAKQVCPDAYSFAFDDQTSTFIVPSGGGWEITFCPEGRSTNILATFGPQLQVLASGAKLTDDEIKSALSNITYIDTRPSSAVLLGCNRLVLLLLALGAMAWLAC